MRFSEHLGTHLTPEWRSQYVVYEEMKKFLYAAEDKLPPDVDIDEEALRMFFAKYDDGFFIFCDKELAKVNTFFAEKLAEAVRKYNELEVEIANAGSERLQKVARSYSIVDPGILEDGALTPNHYNMNGGVKYRKKHAVQRIQKLKEMKFIVSEFYLSLVLIQNFQQLNFTAFRKILKKHDKLFHTTTGVQYRQERVETASFYTNKQIDELIEKTEAIAINDLEGGDRGKAMKRLRVPPLAEQQSTSSSFFWGLFSGIFIVLLVVLGVTAYFKGQQLNWQPAVRMYRGMLVVIVMVGLLGVNVHGWHRAGVNHVLIFELDPRHHLTYIDLLKLAAMFGVFWCMSCLAFLFSQDFQLPAFAQPLALAIFVLIFMLNPTRTFHYRARMWLLKTLFRVSTAPFHAVHFADFWLADQLNSLVVPLLDFQYLVCFYVYDWYQDADEAPMCTNPQNIVRPIVTLLPAWWRFAQCIRRYHDTKHAWPHLVNAGKYSTSMFVTLFSTLKSVKKINADDDDDDDEEDIEALFYVWVCSLLISTFYTLFWDLRMDWGLLDKNYGDNFGLREQIVYDYKAYYYMAILADIIFRFMWTLTVSIGNAGFLHYEFFRLFIATCEIFRRFIWNFFRLENEHLNNCGQFRAVRDISIKPIGKDKEKNNEKKKQPDLTLEQMMDGGEPATLRRSKRKLLSDQDVITDEDISLIDKSSIMDRISSL